MLLLAGRSTVRWCCLLVLVNKVSSCCCGVLWRWVVFLCVSHASNFSCLSIPLMHVTMECISLLTAWLCFLSVCTWWPGVADCVVEGYFSYLPLDVFHLLDYFDICRRQLYAFFLSLRTSSLLVCFGSCSDFGCRNLFSYLAPYAFLLLACSGICRW